MEFDSEDGRHVVLRPLKMSDLDSATKFANSIAKEKRTNLELGLISFDKRVTREEERSFLKALVLAREAGDAVSVAAYVGKKLVGHCDVKRRKAADERHTGVLGVVVLQGYRGAGVGERIVVEALRQAESLGIWLVELSVFAINQRAIHLYEKVGFREAGVIPNKMLRKGRLMAELTMYVDLRGTSKSPSARRRQV